MTNITNYDLVTGEILAWSSLHQRKTFGETARYIEGHIPAETHFILNGRPTERPASPVSRTGLTLHGVPTGSVLHINGVSYDAHGTVDLDFPLPGTYALRVECFPYLDWNDEVAIP